MSAEVATKSRVAVEVEEGHVHWRIRSDDGDLLADTRLTPQQALHFGQRLIQSSFEAKADAAINAIGEIAAAAQAEAKP